MSDATPLPADYPTESNREQPNPQASGKGTTTGATNTVALPSTGSHTGPRISNRRLEDIRTSLSDRDLAILGSVERYRFLSARHLQSLHFTDHASPDSASRTCRRVLALLRGLRILGVLDRRIGGIRAGSEGLVYYIDTAGDRIQRDSTQARTRRRFDEPSARFLDRTLAIADIAIAVTEAAQSHGAEVVKIDPEHHATRTYQDGYGVPQVLRPDLYIELAASVGDDELSAFFIEVDLGHESLPTLLGKSLAYEDYRATGSEQRQFGGFPQVIWAMIAYRAATALRRRKALGDAIERNHRTATSLYRILALPDTAEAPVRGLRHD
ncbi:MAG: replication-relaxation family protein [Glutamicibacter arilaitensis]|uniref:replication-relaxation family protein n=1 Tax=Glutamicibacter arilaitensis TaxID=256701 RepID=UPI003FD19F36